MKSINVYTTENGRIKNVSLEEISKKGTYWIRCFKPNEEEIQKLSRLIKVPAAEFNEFLTEDERPRLVKERYLQIIFATPFKENGEVFIIPFSIFISKNIVLTLENQPVEVLNRIEERFTQNKSAPLLQRGVGYFVFRIMDKVNDKFLSHINNIDDMSTILKKKAKELDSDSVARIYDYSMTLTFFHQGLSANHEVLNALRKTFYMGFSGKDRNNFNELYVDSLALIDNANVQREMMSNLFNLHSILSQQKLNTFMYRISFWALIFMIPTLLSGIFGMNFAHIPFTTHVYGFWIAVSLIFFITLAAVIAFLKITQR